MSEVQPERSDAHDSLSTTAGGKPSSWGLQSPDELIGKRLDDRFRVVEQIGRGGMGAVFKAIQEPLGRVCAIKVLSTSYHGGKDPAFDKRFRREAATMSRLRHPNTVTLYDYGNVGELYYMAMEYVDGRSLHTEIYRNGPIDERRARLIASQICRSLREAHAHGVIHRDLKPENILLVDQGAEVDLVKVLDFGLAKVIEGELADDLHTETGLCMGSPKHMAPEQITGGEVSAHTDIYALGVLLYEMLSLHSPFDRPTRYRTLVAQVQEDPSPFADVVPELNISQKMESIVRRCLEKQRENRFQSMNDLLQALKAVDSPDAPMSAPMPWMQPITSEPPTGERSSSAPSQSAPSSNHSRSPSDEPSVSPLIAPPATNQPSTAVKAGIGLSIAALIVGFGAWQYAASGPGQVHASHTLPVVSTTSTPPHVSSEPKLAGQPHEHVVRIETQPSGAQVLEGNDVLCAQTPCTVRWNSLNSNCAHELRISKAGFVSARHKIVEGDTSVRVRLVQTRDVDTSP